jgi:hypothetical protein
MEDTSTSTETGALPVSTEYAARVEHVISSLAAQHLPATYRNVYRHVRGHRDNLTRYLKWRRGQSTSVTVLEEDFLSDVPEAPELPDDVAPHLDPNETAADRLTRLEAEQEGEQAELQRLQQQRAQGVRLHRDAYVTLLMLSDSVAIREAELDKVRQTLSREQALAAMHHAQEVHDAAVAPIVQLCEQAIAAIADLQAACGELATAIDTQSAALLELRTPRGQPAFDMVDGRSQVRRLIASLPQGGLLMQYLFALTSHEITKGEAAAAVDTLPSTRPLSPVAVRNYITSFEVE